MLVLNFSNQLWCHIQVHGECEGGGEAAFPPADLHPLLVVPLQVLKVLHQDQDHLSDRGECHNYRGKKIRLTQTLFFPCSPSPSGVRFKTVARATSGAPMAPTAFPSARSSASTVHVSPQTPVSVTPASGGQTASSVS